MARWLGSMKAGEFNLKNHRNIQSISLSDRIVLRPENRSRIAEAVELMYERVVLCVLFQPKAEDA